MKVELLKDHEHAGQQYQTGAPLELDADTARRLIEQGVAKSSNEPKRTKQQEE